MIRNYFKSAFRSLRKNWAFTFISIIGLAIGTGAFVTLMNYADIENHYDAFQADKNSIYRVESYFSKGSDIADSWVTSSFGYAAAMQKEFPEIKSTVRINNFECERIVRYKNNIYREPRVVSVDSNFFTFFSYKLLKGDPLTVLKEPNSIVLSTSAAKKYFGTEDPVGKFLEVTTQKSALHCNVTGVYEDFPAQSHLHLDMMLSLTSSPRWLWDTWYMHEAYTYVKVNNKAGATAVEEKFPQLAEKYKTEVALREKTWGVYLVPLADIHLNAFKPYEREAKGSRKTVDFIMIISAIILIVGWTNFINTLVSKALERAGEIGVRKIAGATDRDFIIQFVVESLLVNVLALLMFFIFMLVFGSLFEGLYSENTFYYFWQRPLVWQLIGVTFIAGTLITSIIPFLILKGVNTAAVLKNKMAFRSGMGNKPRLALIVFQYFAAMVLIITTIVVKNQLNYMRSMDLGIGIEQTLVFKAPGKTANYDAKLESLMQTIKGFSGAKAVTASNSIPGQPNAFVMSNQRDNDPAKNSRLCDMMRVDYDFIPAYQLSLLKGRNFSRNSPADKEDAVILTQNALQLFGFKDEEDAMNGAVNLEGQGSKRFPVIGVVKDFHQLSPKEGYRPIILMMFNPWTALDYNFVSVKLSGSSANAIIAATRKQFKNIFPESSFDSFFLDDYFNRQYNDDLKYGSIITLFTWLALIIVCLGIFGLSSFMLIKRTKEIAIRKIIGAGMLQILKLLNLDFIKCIFIAFVLAIPVAWWAMQSWLQNFSHRISLSWWAFLLAIIITIFITLATVSALALKTAISNPTKNLRTE
ncbi:MAG: transporter permease [Ferruginibacter sp.]|nr:transporter permease [Ferruginibacter sp.]